MGNGQVTTRSITELCKETPTDYSTSQLCDFISSDSSTPPSSDVRVYADDQMTILDSLDLYISTNGTDFYQLKSTGGVESSSPQESKGVFKLELPTGGESTYSFKSTPAADLAVYVCANVPFFRNALHGLSATEAKQKISGAKIHSLPSTPRINYAVMLKDQTKLIIISDANKPTDFEAYRIEDQNIEKLKITFSRRLKDGGTTTITTNRGVFFAPQSLFDPPRASTFNGEEVESLSEQEALRIAQSHKIPLGPIMDQKTQNAYAAMCGETGKSE